MTMLDCQELLERARSSVQQARILLNSPTPQALEACQPHLQEANAALTGLPDGLRQAVSQSHSGSVQGPTAVEMLAAVTNFQREVSRLSLLLETAGEFYLGWMQSLSLLTRGYSPQGMAEPLNVESRLLVEG